MTADIHEPPLFLNRDIAMANLRTAIAQARAALALEEGVHNLGQFGAVTYLKGYLEGLQAAEKLL